MSIRAIDKRLTVQSKGEIPREVEHLKSRRFIVGTWYALDHQQPDGPWVIDYTELREE